MKTITDRDLSRIQGGFTLEEILVGAAIGALAYISKDVYDHWDTYKTEFVKGWNTF